MGRGLPSKSIGLGQFEREIMKYRIIPGAAILAVVFSVSESKAQTYWVESAARAAEFEPKAKTPEFKPESPAPIAIRKSSDAKTFSAARFHKTQFLILSAAVYGASLADMHQNASGKKISLVVRNQSGGKAACEAAVAGLLRSRTGHGHWSKLD
jgi:hypothetical protein